MLSCNLAGTVGAATVVVLLAACGKPPPIDSVPTAPPACEILPPPLIMPDTITVAIFERVAPELAPWGHNAGEEQLFHHLYETLVTVDCVGRVAGGLAGSWRSEDDGRRWDFELSDDARFWDGGRVSARDVVESWADALMIDTGVDSVGVDGDRVVRVYFEEPQRDLPLIISAPAFSVAKRAASAVWPLGSGPYEVGFPDEVAPEGGPLGEPFSGAGRAIELRPAFGGERPVIRFIEASAKDARDLLEGPVDLLMTADPTVIEYASGNPRLVTVPLPWEKTYVLLSTARVLELSSDRSPAALPPEFLAVLSRDAVRGAARGSHAPFWWDDVYACRALADSGRARGGPRNTGVSSDPRRILYDADDPTARDLAERIVALAATDPAVSSEAAAIASAVPGLVGRLPVVVAQGVAQRELDRSLRAGDDLAYIVSLPYRPPLPCADLGRLFDRVPWIAGLGSRVSSALVPLVDTRATAIARRDKFGMICDWHGNVLILGETGKGD